MPKIFLIKNRLLQQQLKLLEAQKSREELSPPGSPCSPEPLSLIVTKPPGELWFFNFFLSDCLIVLFTGSEWFWVWLSTPKKYRIYVATLFEFSALIVLRFVTMYSVVCMCGCDQCWISPKLLDRNTFWRYRT